MDSTTKIYVLLKNLEAFINAVPINPKSPNSRAWEKNRAEMKKALKNTYKTLAKQGNEGGLFVLFGPSRGCGVVLSKQVVSELLRVSELFRGCKLVLQKTLREQLEPVKRLEPVRKKR
jgi:hypothetical protein